ncbi:hypothetical protein SGRA_3026 [Saprospira grandis str. Lewin]|uniref:Uncharacterized protein n=1 Tax=Saprospira grandis (strain Lewin) TaxID=984262 RepID=H6KZH8_SAPGL|nr:hypothetical protein SGRA_3026 [Saprospira grandis str. Lewin]
MLGLALRATLAYPSAVLGFAQYKGTPNARIRPPAAN